MLTRYFRYRLLNASLTFLAWLCFWLPQVAELLSPLCLYSDEAHESVIRGFDELQQKRRTKNKFQILANVLDDANNSVRAPFVVCGLGDSAG